jgi:hypothetical protein
MFKNYIHIFMTFTLSIWLKSKDILLKIKRKKILTDLAIT